MVEVDMAGGENNQPEYLAMNPMGTMPVLELDDGSFLSESVAICRYVEEELAPEPNMFGVSPPRKGGNRDVESEDGI